MTHPSSQATFRISEPYPVALRMVREALSRHGLRMPIEFDVSSHLKQELGAGVGPCSILFVDDPALLLEGVVFHRGVALAIPQPVVVSGNQRRSEVILRSAAIADLPASVLRPIAELLRRIGNAVASVAEEEPVNWKAATLRGGVEETDRLSDAIASLTKPA